MLLEANWNNAFIEEHKTFPRGKYKDQIDAVAGAFNKIVDSRGSDTWKLSLYDTIEEFDRASALCRKKRLAQEGRPDEQLLATMTPEEGEFYTATHLAPDDLKLLDLTREDLERVGITLDSKNWKYDARKTAKEIKKAIHSLKKGYMKPEGVENLRRMHLIPRHIETDEPPDSS